MTTNNDDLLESYDDNEPDYDFFQGIQFVMSLTDTSPDIKTIVIRQVQLLTIVEQADTDQERQTAIAEYDSLARVLHTFKE